jgi:hypothetical protein
LGPGRYSVRDVAQCLLTESVFQEECRRQFVSPEPLMRRLSLLKDSDLLSSFNDVKIALCEDFSDFSKIKLKAIMAHFGIPAQEAHINILMNINEKKRFGNTLL